MLSSNENETKRIGEQLGKGLKEGDVVALYGEFGAGKTVLIKGIAKALGCEEKVKSPSFTYVHEYEGRVPVFHIDLYRVNTINDIISLGLHEFFNSEGICLIEWAEKANEILPDSRIDVELKILNDILREITVKEVR